MNALSPWASAVRTLFHGQDLPALFKEEIAGYTVKVHTLNNSLWIAVTCPKGTQVVLRPAYAPNDHLQLEKTTRQEDDIIIHLSASIGQYRVRLQFPDKTRPLIRYTTTFKGSNPLLVPFWPRDMVITGPDESDKEPKGTIHVSQVGTRSGLQYISLDKPASGALLYFQNLTALNDYAQVTETSWGIMAGTRLRSAANLKRQTHTCAPGVGAFRCVYCF